MHSTHFSEASTHLVEKARGLPRLGGLLPGPRLVPCQQLAQRRRGGGGSVRRWRHGLHTCNRVHVQVHSVDVEAVVMCKCAAMS